MKLISIKGILVLLEKKLVLFVLSCVFYSSFFAQNDVTYYLLGRPFNAERNNAITVVGKAWGIQIEYAGMNKIELNGLEYYNKHNDSISKLIGEKTKLGEEWINTFYSEVDKEELEQNEIRSLISVDSTYKTYSVLLFQPYLLMEKKQYRKKNIYTIYLIGQLKSDDQRKFNTHLTYKFNSRKKILKLKSEKKSELKITLPQNGII